MSRFTYQQRGMFALASACLALLALMTFMTFLSVRSERVGMPVFYGLGLGSIVLASVGIVAGGQGVQSSARRLHLSAVLVGEVALVVIAGALLLPWFTA